jgi:HAMP domain-containing protein
VRQQLTSVIAGMALAAGAIGASPCGAQTRLTSLEELRHALAAGDVVAVVPAGGQPVSGRLTRIGDTDLDVRPTASRKAGDQAPTSITIPLDSIQSLERFRDPVKNGAVIGAGIGAGIGATLFISALVVDRNELDEWAGIYAGASAFCVGVGALLGWAVDAAKSRPHIRYDVLSHGGKTVSVLPFYSRGPGIAISVSLTR